MKRLLLLVSALIPLLGLLDTPPDPTLLIYTLFVILFFSQSRLPKFQSYAKFVGVGIGAGWVSEMLSWSSNFLECNPNPALLHSQLLPDLLLAIGFYGAWGIAWSFLLKRYTFSIREIFFIQGIYGIFIEQKGQIFLYGLSTLPVGIIFWLYIFLVYGSIAGLTFLFSGIKGTSNSKWKYIIAILTLFAATFIVSSIWGGVFSPFLPEKAAICARPLW